MKEFLEKLYKEYSNHYVICNANISGYCKKKEMENCEKKDEFRPNVLKSKFFEESDNIQEIAFVNKIVPHSLYDCMLMCMQSKVVSIEKIFCQGLEYIFNVVYKFIEFISNETVIDKFKLNSGYLHICFNYDPFTKDRESGMSEKRFHIHMNYWRKDDIDFSKMVQVKDINIDTIYSIIDPITIIGESIIYDYLIDKKMLGKIMKNDTIRDSQMGLPIGFKIEYSKWGILNETQFRKEIVFLHNSLCEIYNNIEKIFLYEDSSFKVWKRKKLRKKDEIKVGIENLEWLSEKSKNYLYFLANNFMDIPDNIMNLLQRKKSMRIKYMSVNGLNYSMALFSEKANSLEKKIINHNKIILVIQPKMFSEIGGASLPCMNNISTIRLYRNSKLYTEEEKQSRENFHNDFLKYIN